MIISGFGGLSWQMKARSIFPRFGAVVSQSFGRKGHPMNTEKKRQTTLRITYSKIPQWHCCLREMQKCNTLDALVTLHGPPHHKVQREGFEIWHYPLGVESGMFYSIHVSVWPNQSKQVFLYFEPASKRRFPLWRRWWQFWKTKDDTPAQQRTYP
jgi:hypothetical protein